MIELLRKPNKEYAANRLTEVVVLYGNWRFSQPPRIVAATVSLARHMREHAKSTMAGPVRAAQYVRMSTEHQQYSTENQADTMGAMPKRVEWRSSERTPMPPGAD